VMVSAGRLSLPPLGPERMELMIRAFSINPGQMGVFSSYCVGLTCQGANNEEAK
jgi:hypothetical protein